MTRRILLIDDNDDLREIVELALELTADVEVVTASSGREGFEVAREDPPDAILLDVKMPDIDGPTTLKLLRDEPRTADIPVLFITASVQPSERAHYAELGVAGLVEKPFDPVAIGPAVIDKLGWR